MNQILISGNLGQDPEMAYSNSGVPYCNMSVATNERWTGQDGQQMSKTVWFRVTAWRGQAESCSQYLTKGSKVLVIGQMEEPYAYINNEGIAAASLQVTARTVEFLSPSAYNQQPQPATGYMNSGMTGSNITNPSMESAQSLNAGMNNNMNGMAPVQPAQPMNGQQPMQPVQPAQPMNNQPSQNGQPVQNMNGQHQQPNSNGTPADADNAPDPESIPF